MLRQYCPITNKYGFLKKNSSWKSSKALLVRVNDATENYHQKPRKTGFYPLVFYEIERSSHIFILLLLISE